MLELNKKYKLAFLIGEQCMNYTGVINSIENGFVEFTDKFNNVITFNLNSLQFFEEVK